MSENTTQQKTGGRFLVESIGTSPVFSRENFSEEHQEIEQMIREFANDRIRENADEINKFNKDNAI